MNKKKKWFAISEEDPRRSRFDELYLKRKLDNDLYNIIHSYLSQGRNYPRLKVVVIKAGDKQGLTWFLEYLHRTWQESCGKRGKTGLSLNVACNSTLTALPNLFLPTYTKKLRTLQYYWTLSKIERVFTFMFLAILYLVLAPMILLLFSWAANASKQNIFEYITKDLNILDLLSQNVEPINIICLLFGFILTYLLSRKRKRQINAWQTSFIIGLKLRAEKYFISNLLERIQKTIHRIPCLVTFDNAEAIDSFSLDLLKNHLGSQNNINQGLWIVATKAEDSVKWSWLDNNNVDVSFLELNWFDVSALKLLNTKYKTKGNEVDSPLNFGWLYSGIDAKRIQEIKRKWLEALEEFPEENELDIAGAFELIMLAFHNQGYDLFSGNKRIVRKNLKELIGSQLYKFVMQPNIANVSILIPHIQMLWKTVNSYIDELRYYFRATQSETTWKIHLFWAIYYTERSTDNDSQIVKTIVWHLTRCSQSMLTGLEDRLQDELKKQWINLTCKYAKLAMDQGSIDDVSQLMEEIIVNLSEHRIASDLWDNSDLQSLLLIEWDLFYARGESDRLKRFLNEVKDLPTIQPFSNILSCVIGLLRGDNFNSLRELLTRINQDKLSKPSRYYDVFVLVWNLLYIRICHGFSLTADLMPDIHSFKNLTNGSNSIENLSTGLLLLDIHHGMGKQKEYVQFAEILARLLIDTRTDNSTYPIKYACHKALETRFVHRIVLNIISDKDLDTFSLQKLSNILFLLHPSIKLKTHLDWVCYVRDLYIVELVRLGYSGLMLEYCRTLNDYGNFLTSFGQSKNNTDDKWLMQGIDELRRSINLALSMNMKYIYADSMFFLFMAIRKEFSDYYIGPHIIPFCEELCSNNYPISLKLKYLSEANFITQNFHKPNQKDDIVKNVWIKSELLRTMINIEGEKYSHFKKFVDIPLPWAIPQIKALLAQDLYHLEQMEKNENRTAVNTMKSAFRSYFEIIDGSRSNEQEDLSIYLQMLVSNLRDKSSSKKGRGNLKSKSDNIEIHEITKVGLILAACAMKFVEDRSVIYDLLNEKRLWSYSVMANVLNSWLRENKECNELFVEHAISATKGLIYKSDAVDYMRIQMFHIGIRVQDLVQEFIRSQELSLKRLSQLNYDIISILTNIANGRQQIDPNNELSLFDRLIELDEKHEDEWIKKREKLVASMLRADEFLKQLAQIENEDDFADVFGELFRLLSPYCDYSLPNWLTLAQKYSEEGNFSKCAELLHMHHSAAEASTLNSYSIYVYIRLQDDEETSGLNEIGVKKLLEEVKGDKEINMEIRQAVDEILNHIPWNKINLANLS